MGLIYNKYPGEWHGPGSISNVIKDLNKLYQPVEDLKIVHFSDGMIYYDKIKKVACETFHVDYMTRKMMEGFEGKAEEEVSKI